MKTESRKSNGMESVEELSGTDVKFTDSVSVSRENCGPRVKLRLPLGLHTRLQNYFNIFSNLRCLSLHSSLDNRYLKMAEA